MNILAMGLPFWGDRAGLARYQSAAGHEVRTLGIAGDVDYTFTADETAAGVIVRVAQDWRPDLFLCMCPEMYPPPLAIEDCPIRTAAMISDWNLYQPQLEHNLARFDGVLSDRLGSQTLAVWGARPQYWGPVYAHRPLIHRDLGLARDLDIVFLGNLNHAIHRRRGQMLERVAALAGRYRVLISGEHAPEDYAAVMNRARIVVNHTLRGEMNLRCFEAPACGALLLVEAENLEVAEWLRPDAEVVLYTLENIEARLVHFLEHEDERARIAAAGQARIATLAPECRMDDLLNWIAAQPVAPRAFHSLDAEMQALAGLLWMGSSMTPEQRAWAQAEGARLPERFPESAAALLATAGLALDRAVASTDRAADLKRALEALHAACAARPDLIVAWLNLASVARQLRASTLERSCLEHALDADCPDLGGYLYGSIHEPFFAAWRRALGEGKATRAMLHAGAATQLGAWHRVNGAAARGRELEDQALGLWPEFTPAILLAGECLGALGDWEAAIERYARALPLCPFDADVRRSLVTALRQAGRADEAQALALESAALFGAGAMWQDAAAEFSALAKA
jgi:tetratricopeptide (TPR) repeat protein